MIDRPNVGKSTLVNRLLGEERVVAFDQPGTTRDSIYIPFERDGRQYTLIDTAGVRRKGKVDEMIEKFSIVKTPQAMKDAHVVVVVVDAREGIVEQDLHLIGRFWLVPEVLHQVLFQVLHNKYQEIPLSYQKLYGQEKIRYCEHLWMPYRSKHLLLSVLHL